MSDLMKGLMSDKTKKSTEVLTLRISESLMVRLNNVANKVEKGRAEVAKSILESGLNEIEAKLN